MGWEVELFDTNRHREERQLDWNLGLNTGFQWGGVDKEHARAA
jgi:hypothetical protein